MTTQVDIKQGTDEWLNFRKSHITATDIAPIVGVCPWDETAYTLFFKKTSKEPVVKKDSKYLEWGTRLEPILIDKVAEVLNIENVRRGNCYVDGWMMASLDGEGDINGEHVIIEAKTTSHKDGWWDEDGNETIPVHYQLQAMWQMIVTGYRRVVFTVYCGAICEWWSRTIVYDAEMANEIIEEATNFYNSIGKEEPPKPMTQKYTSAAEAERLARQRNSDERNASEEVDSNVAAEFIKCKKEFENAEVNLKNATNALLEELHGAKVATVNGVEVIRLVKSGRNGYKYVLV